MHFFGTFTLSFSTNHQSKCRPFGQASLLAELLGSREDRRED